MKTTISNMIRVEEPSETVREYAKTLRLPNPDFEKKQRMGFWTGRTPKEIRLYERDGNALVFPFGLMKELWPMVRRDEWELDFRQNETVEYGDTDMGLYDYQHVAVQKMIEAKYGILKAGCGSGKTQCAIAIIKALRKKTLWLCNKHDLLKQSIDRAKMYIDPSLFGVITAGKINIGTGITFATVQTLAKADLTRFRHCWDVIIVDECHAVSTSPSTVTMYQRVLNNLAARHIFGLTATPHRADGLIKATYSLIGEVAYEIPKEATASKTTPVKIRTVETGTRLSDECLNEDGTLDVIKLITFLTSDYERNKLIAKCIMDEKDHSCMILSDRLDQLKAIRNLLPYEMQEQSVYIDGKMTSKTAREEREQAMEQMRSGEKKYFFGSFRIAREGLDIPRLDRLFMASPVKNEAIVEQSVGRIRRTHESKKDVPVVYDFKDENIGKCVRWYKERCRVYRSIEAEFEKGFLGTLC